MNREKGPAFIKNISFSKKVLIPLVSALAAIIFLSVGISYWESSKRLREEISYSHTVLLQQINQNIDFELKRIDTLVMKMMSDVNVISFMRDRFDRASDRALNGYELAKGMVELQSTNSFIFSIYYYSKKTGKVISQGGTFDKAEFFDSQCITAIDDFDSYYLWMSTRKLKESNLSDSNSRNVITLIRPYPLSAGLKTNIEGAIVVNIDEDLLYRVIKNAKPHRLGHIFIVDSAGRVVSHDNKSLINKDMSSEKYIQHILSTDDDVQSADFLNGARESIFAVTSKYTRWKYISAIPDSQINEPLSAMLNVLLIFGGLIFLLAVAVVVVINNWTIRPIDKFIQSIVNRVKDNEMTGTVSKTVGSAKDLERIFNNMLMENEKMQVQIKESIPAIKWRLVTDILMGNKTDFTEIETYFKLVGHSLYQTNFCVMVIDLDDKLKLSREIPAGGLSLYTSALCKKAEELINEESKGVAIEQNDSKVVLLMSFKENSIKKVQMELISVIDLIKSFMSSCFNLTVTIGAGHVYKDISGIRKSYKEAEEALEYRIVMGNNSTIFFEEVNSFDNKELYRIYSMVNGIADSVKSADSEKMLTLVSRFFAETVDKNLPPEMIRQASIQMIMQATKVAMDVGVPIDNITVENGFSAFEAVNQYETVEPIKQHIVDILKKLINNISGRRNNKNSNEMIGHILEYIQQNYPNSSLSLNEIADKFNLSVPYISKIFKEATESNFFEYLISVRMEKAKGLLADGKNKIYEIGEKVGYINYNSFTRIFKKYTGVTPGEYRNQIFIDNAFRHEED